MPPTSQPQQPPSSQDRECPILVWMLALNRDYLLEEYEEAYKIVQTCDRHVKIKHDPDNPESFRRIMTHLLPLLMMRHRRIPRNKWTDKVSPQGKHWIEQSPDDLPPDKFLYSMIGYHLCYDYSLCGMVMTQGSQRRVVNIGLGIQRMLQEPKGVPIATFVESMAHKLTPTEMSFVSPDLDEATVRRRLTILLTMKSAYIKAIGQGTGIDWSRIEFNIPAGTAISDGHPLTGWEFRIFVAKLGVSRGYPVSGVVPEDYVCVVAFFRGYPDSSQFVFYETEEQLDAWVQFINIDQMVKVLPKLLT